MARLKSNVKRTKGTDIVRIFWDDDEGLLKYRHQHLRTGLMVSVGKWLHIYDLQDEQGFQKKPHYTHTKTKPKVCVASRADIPEQVRPGQPRNTAGPGEVGSLGRARGRQARGRTFSSARVQPDGRRSNGSQRCPPSCLRMA
jgi:hypothetical protein